MYRVTHTDTENRELWWCQLCPHWCTMAACGVTSDDKVGIMTTLDFLCTSTIQSAIDAHAPPTQGLLDHWLMDIMIYRISLALCALGTQHAGIWAHTTVQYDSNFPYPLITVMCMQADFSRTIDSTCSSRSPNLWNWDQRYTTGKKYGIIFISAIFCILWVVYGISLFDLHSCKQILLWGS